MPLDVYFKEDVYNILRATALASEASASALWEVIGEQEDAGKLMYMYKQGFSAALGAVALAFGYDLVVAEKRSDRCSKKPPPQQP